MNDAKYIGLDVHQATISVAVRDAAGELVMEAILETRAETILQFLGGLRGTLQVALEEGTWAAWLHDLLQPHVARVVVCDSRKNPSMKKGNKSDRLDARKLARLLRLGELQGVYHGNTGLRMVKELARSYLTVTKDLIRVMNRLKAVYRAWGIPCAGQKVYAPRYRAEWLGKISQVAVRRRAELYYQQLDALRPLHQQARRELLAEGNQHIATKWLRRIPSIGPIRAVLLLALMQTPHRFRTKRQLWTYSGLALETRDSGEYKVEHGQFRRSKKHPTIRGLNKNHNHDLKNIFKGAATHAAVSGPFQEFYATRIARGMRVPMARLTLARKIAAIALAVWKKGVCFDAKYLKQQAA